MNLLRTVSLVMACALPLAAMAQWQWIDKDGRKVFSDRSPPPDIPARNILKQPGGRPVPAEPAMAAASPAASAAAKPASAPRISGKDKELEDKRKQGEAAEAEKKKAEDEKLAKVQAENCDRAKRAKATFDSGMRVAQTNAKGEREVLDDNARAAETNRLQAIIKADCKAS